MNKKEFIDYCNQEGGIIICFHDREGKYLYVNDAFLELTGYTEEEVIGADRFKFYHSEDLNYIREQSHNPSLEGESNIRIECRFRKKDCSFAWLQTETIPVVDENGVVVNLITKSIDVTEIMTLKSELDIHQGMLEKVRIMSKVGAWHVEVPEMKVKWSKETYDIHEVPQSFKPQIDSAINFFPQDSKAELSAALDNAIKNAEPYDLTLKFVTAKNNQIWVRAIGKPLLKNGSVIKVYGVFQNVNKEEEAKKNAQRFLDYLSDNKDLIQKFLPDLNKIK